MVVTQVLKDGIEAEIGITPFKPALPVTDVRAANIRVLPNGTAMECDEITRDVRNRMWLEFTEEQIAYIRCRNPEISDEALREMVQRGLLP